MARTVWGRLTWLARGYRIWSLGVFTVALIQLVMLGDQGSWFAAFCICFPFGMALVLAYKLGDRTSGWIMSFLLLVDLGVIIAPDQKIFPFLNLFPRLPPTENRILSWYFLLYGSLQFVVVPPVAFGRSLRVRWQGGQPMIGAGVCVLGLATWSFVISFLTFVFVMTR